MQTSLINHGSITLSQNKQYLQHTDGMPFFWFADTWWFGGTKRTSIEDFKLLIKDRREEGFTVIQIVVGIPPETDPFSDDAANSGGLPFNKDFTLNKTYFKEIDTKIQLLIENDLVPCIVGGWGHHIDILGVEPIKRLWDEILVRYGHLPVIFCLCGEVNAIMPPVPKFLQTETRRKKVITFLKRFKLFAVAQRSKQKIQYYYFKQRDKQLVHKRLQQWNEIAEYITSANNNKRLLTVHVAAETTAQALFRNDSWLKINTIQSGHDKNAITFMVQSIREADKTKMPIINMEPWYEGIQGNFDDYYQRVAFWLCILSGAKGHTYGAHGVWQMAEEGDHFMGHWGESYWKDAMGYKGTEQLGNAVALLKKYDWWKLKPVYDLISPTWNKTNPWLPVVAKIDKNYLIYLPDVHLCNSQITINIDLTSRKVRGYHPDTMKEIALVYKGKTVIIPPLQTKDLLIII